MRKKLVIPAMLMLLLVGSVDTSFAEEESVPEKQNEATVGFSTASGESGSDQSLQEIPLDPSLFTMDGFCARLPEGWVVGEEEDDRVYLYPSGSSENAYSYVMFRVSEDEAFLDLTPKELEEQFEELQENLSQGGHVGVSIRRFSLNGMPGHRLFMSMKMGEIRVDMDVTILVKDKRMATVAFYTISGLETENYRRSYENFLLSVKPAKK